MQIEDFKRMHWVLIGLVLGALLAYARTMISPDEQTGGGRGISVQEFVQNIARPKTGNGFAWMKDVTVYPAQPISDPVNGEKKSVSFVSAKMLTLLPKDKVTDKDKNLGQYKDVHFTAEIPFKVGNMVKPTSDNYTIVDYLAETKKAFPDVVSYRFAWWARPQATYAIWMGGAVLLIGGLWPSLINLMIGAGLGKPHKTKEEIEKEEYDLERFGKSSNKKSKPVPVVKAGMSAADAEKLRDMQDQMEKELAGAGMRMTTGEPASAGAKTIAPALAGVKALTGTAVEPTAPINPVNDEPKEYTGDYYPVVKAHHHDEPKK